MKGKLLLSLLGGLSLLSSSTAFAHLDTFEELAVKNAGRVFQQLELEFF